MADRFEIPDLPSTADPAGTHAALDDAFDAAQAALNTIDDEAALIRYLLHGVGRAEGCVLSLESGALRLSNGYFLAGAGVDSSDPDYFPGARLVRINGVPGYVELSDPNLPPPNGEWFGHMSAFGDVLWFDAPQVPRPNGRWLIGAVTTDIGGDPTEVDASVADVLGQAIGGGGEGGEVSRAEFNALKERVMALEASIPALRAELIALLQAGGVELIPSPWDVLADNLACVAAAAFEDQPHGVERPQMAIVGRLFGHGQDDTPDFTPDTENPNELPFNSETGLFGP